MGNGGEGLFSVSIKFLNFRIDQTRRINKIIIFLYIDIIFTLFEHISNNIFYFLMYLTLDISYYLYICHKCIDTCTLLIGNKQSVTIKSIRIFYRLALVRIIPSFL